MLGREFSGMTYPQIGVPDAHHPVTHHALEPEKIAKVAKINAYHVQLFAYLLERLRATPDGDGTLLDHITLMYGTGLVDCNAHADDQRAGRAHRRRRRLAEGRPPHPLSAICRWPTCT